MSQQQPKQLSVDVGGLSIMPFSSMSEALDQVISEQQVKPGFGVSVNSEIVMLARRDPALMAHINKAQLRFADGIGVVKTIASKGVPNTRLPGCEFWEALMLRAGAANAPVMLIGAKPEVNKAAVAKLQAQGVNVVCGIDGYFSDERVLRDALAEHQPKIVTVAMGAPKQEQLIVRLREFYPDAFYLGVGGTYDVYTGHVKRAPKLFCDLHLEWFYRLCAQPTRIGRQWSLAKYLALHVTRQL
ncbi:WecB/TagA/CpsF family glycosyltransferase [Pseudidiomarina sp. 1ASP75-14]|uniref:WecB/TagA/CpsF family glycosyltransferase n=1 Tax=Pseudidiomarina terrestris TaxID=2820060 RepID=UPI0026563B40|nr:MULTISPECIES: WecB/TagA/CpsF family glycosyltransferase [unclassified Pseudidiomarina]MDN7126964.1 WecB/TagA/CpsF family glycosyltransferase [Pseudidiomarina sp. 1APR75-33.1]MDN7136805.1 WecB/TagA/CpsF family glycosyltransferase [Pseudidiomarina sp. 1ASP75-14]